jgi:hypothetical protein
MTAVDQTAVASPESLTSPANCFGTWFRESRSGVLELLKPGWPSAGWGKLAVLLLAGAVAADLLIIWAGRAFHGDSARYFGERQIGTILPVAALIATGVTCLKLFGRLRPDPFAQFWLWLGVLFIFAGIDDLLRIHEQLDRHIHRLLGLDPANRFTNHLDDLIVALYAVPAMLLGVRHLPRLLRLRWTVITLAAAFGCFATMVILDWREGSRSIEESFKVIAATLIFTAILGAAGDPQLKETEPAHERLTMPTTTG